MEDVSGWVVVVTGASRGLGRALARGFAAAGARLAVAGRDRAALEALAAEVGGAFAVEDLRDPEAPRRAVEGLREALGPIEVLVNNAGAGRIGPFAEASDEALREEVALNVTAPLLAARAVVPDMIARGRGQLIHVASDLGRKPQAGMAAYAATKHALVGLSQSLARELRVHGVKSWVVTPGIMNTHFGGNTPQAERQAWQLDVEAVAELIVDTARRPPYLLVDELSVHPLGQDF